MKQFIGPLVITGVALAGSVASAQESGAGAGRAEVSAFPGGGILIHREQQGIGFHQLRFGWIADLQLQSIHRR